MGAAEVDSAAASACAPEAGSTSVLPGASEAGAPPPSSWTRWTLSRLVTRLQRVFGVDVCRETVRKLLHRIGLSWKKAKKLLGRADPDKRREFIADIRALLDEVRDNEDLVLAYIDEAHVHQDADLGYGWSTRGQRLWVTSSSPGLNAKVSFYGVYLYSESRVHIWPYERANGEHTMDVLRRLRDEFPERPLVVVWDGAPYHRAGCVLDLAKSLNIRIVRLPAYSPDFMPVEALWRWLRESVTYNHCHWTAEELKARVETFVETVNANPCKLADRLWVKDELVDEEEAMRFKRTGTPSGTAKDSAARADSGPSMWVYT